MRHPTDGTLRRLLDEPAGVADADAEHVATCPTCLAALAASGQDAAAVAAVLAPPADPDVDAGWQRLSAALATPLATPLATAPAAPLATGPANRAAPAGAAASTASARSRWVARLRSPVVAIAGVVLLLTGAGVAAAADWWPIFRTEQVAPVAITDADLVALPDLSAYGELTVIREPDVHQVPDAATAQAQTGLTVPEVAELPRGVSATPVIEVGGQAEAVFTFSATRAGQAVAPATLPAPPPGMDGAQFRLVAGPGLAQLWPADSGLPALVVARAIAPSGYSSGIDFGTARDYLLALPGLPPDLVSQLRGFGGDGTMLGTTLPLPLPADQVSSADVQIDGVPGQLLTSRDGSMAAVVWVQDGLVTAVGGTLDVDEVLAVASGLR